MHGLLGREYGHALNLIVEDIDSIIEQGKMLGCNIYIYTGGEPLVRKAVFMALRKAPRLRVSMLHQRNAHR